MVHTSEAIKGLNLSEAPFIVMMGFVLITIWTITGLCGTLTATDILVPPEHHHDTTEHLPISQFEGLDHHNGTIIVNGTLTNMTIHDHINLSLGDDEERVLSGGEVKVRKKRTFCRKCYPTQSYGYGGGGGCCGQCGQCGGGYGGGYYRPAIKVVKVVKIPFYGGGGGGCRTCYNPCNVCGR